MVSSLSNILPVNIVGTVSGTVASGTPTAIFSRATVQNVVIVTEDPIPMNLVEGPAGSRVKGRRTTDQLIPNGSDSLENLRFTDPDDFDTDNWHDHTGPDTVGSVVEDFTVPAGESGLYIINITTLWENIAATSAVAAHVIVDDIIVASESYVLTGTANVNHTAPASNVTEIRELLAGEVVNGAVTVENTGGAQNVISGSLTIVKLGALAVV